MRRQMNYLWCLAIQMNKRFLSSCMPCIRNCIDMTTGKDFSYLILGVYPRLEGVFTELSAILESGY